MWSEDVGSKVGDLGEGMNSRDFVERFTINDGTDATMGFGYCNQRAGEEVGFAAQIKEAVTY